MAQIRQLADQPQRAAVLMEARAGQIQKEVKELERVRQVCLEVRDSGWRFDTLDPQLLEMKLEWEKKGKDIMKKDRIDSCLLYTSDAADE